MKHFLNFCMLVIGILSVAGSLLLLFVNIESVGGFKVFMKLICSSLFLFLTGRYLIITAIELHQEYKHSNDN